MKAVVYKFTNIPHIIVKKCKYFSGLKYELHKPNQEFAERLSQLFDIQDKKHLFEIFSKFNANITIFRYETDINDDNDIQTVFKLYDECKVNKIDIYSIIEFVLCREFNTIITIGGIENKSEFKIGMKNGLKNLSNFTFGKPTNCIDKLIYDIDFFMI